MTNCVEWSIDEYDAKGGVTSTTIRIETCGSEDGSSRRSSRKSSSTVRRRRRKKRQQQLWLTGEEEDFSSQTSHALRHVSFGGKARCSVKAPFSSGAAGAPYNKKLRKKNMQQHQHRLLFGSETATNVGVETSSSSFFISSTHRAVAEATTPWNNNISGPCAGRYHFFGQGGLLTNGSYAAPRGKREADEDEDDGLLSRNSGRRVRAKIGGSSCLLAPLRSPSVLPPPQLLPASRAEVNSDILERCFLETRLEDDDDFLLL
ncbi:hypothetical protein TraAM80_06555 [Trypanosoma rangeli]|uniref:Uncharacterized protein n=1 Tax=Trypanosoma rangeli TaxID=5698 RepID=A0A3R7N8I9_TRYRA|nr:uncharacterized protein TraAM80_06555 [Trypanosoma rangeli]RNF02167.1 hypothetical protein TraAM80_06555 [Trypanosoma rangeli]|eukprot:RNF02167.1 hypothetical protein TraAM80_06555 [Trypanosoma rangeli]